MVYGPGDLTSEFLKEEIRSADFRGFLLTAQTVFLSRVELLCFQPPTSSFRSEPCLEFFKKSSMLIGRSDVEV